MLNDRPTREFLDTRVLSRLAGMPLFARRPMLGNVSGKHTSPNRGSSVEFAEYRKYVPGDDLRRLDWRAYGRTDRFYVKEFEADTNLRCVLVVDTSGSMGYGSTGITKLQYARQIAAGIAYLAVQQGDAVGLACIAGGVVTNIPTRRNAAHLSVIFDTLEQARATGGSELVSVLHELAETISQRALVIVISDFFVDPEMLRGCFEHLRFRKHDLSLFHLLDPAELDFKFNRPTRFLDMEGGAPIFAEPSEIVDRYQRALREYLDMLGKVVLETGVDYHRVPINQPYDKVLMRFLTGRARGRGIR
jgi:uncharacterized protein (DUF58 family)